MLEDRYSVQERKIRSLETGTSLLHGLIASMAERVKSNGRRNSSMDDIEERPGSSHTSNTLRTGR